MENDGYKVIPEFPNYEINLLEQVRRVKDKKSILRIPDKRKQRFELYKNGVGYKRFSKGLVESAFPEYFKGDN